MSKPFTPTIGLALGPTIGPVPLTTLRINPVLTQAPTPKQNPVMAVPEVVMPRNIGQMTWKGLRGGSSKTYSGLDLDVVKSALQKYIRRNMPQKALLSAIELYRFGEVGGIAAVTNMYNRLAIIANEDIGPANLSLVL